MGIVHVDNIAMVCVGKIASEVPGRCAGRLNVH